MCRHQSLVRMAVFVFDSALDKEEKQKQSERICIWNAWKQWYSYLE